MTITTEPQGKSQKGQLWIGYTVWNKKVFYFVLNLKIKLSKTPCKKWLPTDFEGVKETTGPKKPFPNQEKQKLLWGEHSTPIKLCGMAMGQGLNMDNSSRGQLPLF